MVHNPLSNLFPKSKSIKGTVSYDNPRQNIDPEIQTKVLFTQEISGGNLQVVSGSISRTATTDYDIANKKYVDDNAGTTFWSRVGTTIVPKTSGDVVSGSDLVMTDHISAATLEIQSGAMLLTPVNNLDIANKKYVDDQISPEALWDRQGIILVPQNAGDTISGSNLVMSGSISGATIEVLSGSTVIAPTDDRDITNLTYVNTGVATLTNKTMSSFTNDISADHVHEQLRNETGVTLNRGDAVFISGFNVGLSIALVTLADNTSTTTMPAVAVLEDSTLANNATGDFVSLGTIHDIDTDQWAVGDELYVSGSTITKATLTKTKPTGIDAQIQKVATVLRSSTASGKIELFGAGRANDSPNTIDIPGEISGASLLTKGNISGANLHATNNISGATIHSSGTISGADLYTVGTLFTTGDIDSDGTISGADLHSSGKISGATLHAIDGANGTFTTADITVTDGIVTTAATGSGGGGDPSGMTLRYSAITSVAGAEADIDSHAIVAGAIDSFGVIFVRVAMNAASSSVVSVKYTENAVDNVNNFGTTFGGVNNTECIFAQHAQTATIIRSAGNYLANSGAHTQVASTAHSQNSISGAQTITLRCSNGGAGTSYFIWSVYY